MNVSLTPEQIGGVVGGIGAVALLLKKYGLLTFGRPAERRGCPEAVQRVCTEHGEMRVHIGVIKEDVAELKSVQKIIEQDIKELLKRNGYRS